MSPLPVLLLLISNLAALVLALAISRRLAPNHGFAGRAAALLTSYVALVSATLALLGLACRLDPWWATAAVAIPAGALLLLRGRALRAAAAGAPSAGSEALAARQSAWQVTLTAATVGLLALYVAKAVLLATPFVTDDLIYHAPATAHWIQAERLMLAPHGYHMYFPLLSELFTTWFVLPLHADAFASLSGVVWVLLAAAAVGAIAARVRGSREAGLTAALCLLVAPAILHGSESFGGIDVAVAALVLAALLFAIPRPGTASRASDFVLSGIALGLALGCRVTVAPAALMLAIFAWTSSRAEGAGAASRRLLLFLAAVVAAGGAWYLRNWLLTGNPVFPAALGPFAGPFDSASQDRTRLALRLLDPADLSARLAMLQSMLNWPLPLALLCGAGYVGGLLAMLRGRNRGVIALLWWTGVCLAIAAALAPFSGTTNAPDAPLVFRPRYFLAPFAIGLALFAATVSLESLKARMLVAITVVWSFAAWRAPAPAWLVPVAAALGVLVLRRMEAAPRRWLMAAAVVCAPLLLVPLAASKQAATDEEVVRGFEWRELAASLRALEAQPPGLRIARFGPGTYRYYPLFGRRLQFEPLITHADGTPEIPLHLRWKSAGPWWASAPDTSFAAADFAARLRAQAVELVFITRNPDTSWPPQRDALAGLPGTREVFVDDHASLWRLDRASTPR